MNQIHSIFVLNYYTPRDGRRVWVLCASTDSLDWRRRGVEINIRALNKGIALGTLIAPHSNGNIAVVARR